MSRLVSVGASCFAKLDGHGPWSPARKRLTFLVVPCIGGNECVEAKVGLAGGKTDITNSGFNGGVFFFSVWSVGVTSCWGPVQRNVKDGGGPGQR